MKFVRGYKTISLLVAYGCNGWRDNLLMYPDMLSVVGGCGSVQMVHRKYTTSEKPPLYLTTMSQHSSWLRTPKIDFIIVAGCSRMVVARRLGGWPGTFTAIREAATCG